MTPPTPTPPAAILFDMDGTLVDTERYWMAAELELIREFDIDWGENDAQTVIGYPIPETARIMQERGVPLENARIVERLGARVAELLAVEVPWRPGAFELLSELHAAGIPMALVTMSYRETVDAALASLDASPFGTLVTGDRVSRGKPHPEPYLTAAHELGVPISDCVAIEDSPTGLASAVASGAAPIFVPNLLTVDADPGFTIWPTLRGRHLDDLSRVLTDHQHRNDPSHETRNA